MLKKRQSIITVLSRISRFDSQSLTMSAAAASTDSFLLRSQLHTRSSIINGDFLHRLNPVDFYNSNKGGGKANRLLTLRSCFDSSSTHKKARALAQHRRLLHGLGSEEQRCGGGTTDLADGRGVGGNTTRFQGNDKIVVAVDIDEGM